MAYLSRRIQLQRFFKELPYESAEFGEEAYTMKEAIALVEKDIEEYVKEKKAQLKPKKTDEEIPFPSKNPNRK